MDRLIPNWIFISALISNFSMPVLPAYFTLNENLNELCTVTRAAYDIGSDGTKFMLARVNLCQGVIEQVLLQESIPVAYRDDLYQSPDKGFSPHIRRVGLQALSDAKLKMESQASSISQHCAIATASFRAATNASDYINEISHNVDVQVVTLSQHDEGKLAFYSVLSKMPAVDPASIMVWDIGGGSMQLTTLDPKGEWHVLGTELASRSFLRLLLERVLAEPSEAITPDKITKALALANLELPFETLGQPLEVIGIGSVHNKIIQPLCQSMSPSHVDYYTVQDLENVMSGFLYQRSLDKTELLKFSNVILVYASLKKLGITQVRTLGTSNVEGLLLKGC